VRSPVVVDKADSPAVVALLVLCFVACVRDHATDGIPPPVVGFEYRRAIAIGVVGLLIHFRQHPLAKVIEPFQVGLNARFSA
jgi:hypothetical protein